MLANKREIMEGRKIGFVPKQAKNQIIEGRIFLIKELDFFHICYPNEIHYISTRTLGQKDTWKLPPNQEQICKNIQVWCNSKAHVPANLNQIQACHHSSEDPRGRTNPFLKAKASRTTPTKTHDLQNSQTSNFQFMAYK